MNENKDLTPAQLAERWDITRVWLYMLKAKNQVPPYRKLGMGKKPRIVFKIDDVIEFENEHFA
tara:strand:- start:1843 stop:2031 length:189 start_codon:yes stop_codon:yes gene_type:complete